MVSLAQRVAWTLAWTVLSGTHAASAGATASDPVLQRVAASRIPFVENQGQIRNPAVCFVARTFGGTVGITREGEIVYGLGTGRSGDAGDDGRILTEKPAAGIGRAPCGLTPAGAVVSYFLGNDSARWQSGVPAWDTVSLGETAAGIAVAVRAHGNTVEKIFTVRPAADPAAIDVEVQGAEALAVDQDGALRVRRPGGDALFSAPVAYQDSGGQRRYVPAAYRVRGRHYGFEVGAYDAALPLVIDPLLAATYIGGDNVDQAYAVATDAAGNIYVAGRSTSTNYPTMPGAYNGTFAGNYDIVISKFGGSLTNLIASTYLGGSGQDVVAALALSASGQVYVAGYTASSNYPTTVGAWSRVSGGGPFDGVVSKLDGSLTNLLASTYLGGTGTDALNALMPDASGRVYVAGYSSSTNYPTTAGAWNQTHSGPFFDAVITRLDAALGTVQVSTYLGGSDNDWAESLALGADGSVVVAGRTSSTNYPTTPGAYARARTGAQALTVSRLDASLSNLIASTYVGPVLTVVDRIVNVVAAGTAGVWVAASTTSTNYPTTPGAFQTSQRDGGLHADAVVSRLDSGLSNLLASTYLGGTGEDTAYALALDAAGNVLVAGASASTNYPTLPWAVATSNSGSTAFTDIVVTKLDPNLEGLLASTYLGGNRNDGARALALDAAGNILVAGSSDSTNFPTTAGAFASARVGLNFEDVVIAKLNADLSGWAPNATISGIGTGGDGDILVRWTATNVLRYTLQGTTNLAAPVWQDIPPAARQGPAVAPWELQATNAGAVWTNALRFYRIQSLP